MTPDQFETIRRLCKKHKITFNRRRSPSEWPVAHAGLFADVRKLGDTQYSTYAKSKESRSPDEPWGAHAIGRANRVVEIADRCQRERPNEAGWRLALEHEIFSRFTVEVACRKCRARIWRSEIEVSIESNNLDGPSLEQRRKLRTQCQCPPMSRQYDLNDTGLNPLFSCRAEELVEHEQSVRLALARQEHPDLIYGLRETTIFEKALYSPSSKHTRADGGPKLVNEAIRVTPFKQVGEPLLFPFLILEAKSAKGEDFDSIQKQTAFPIRTLLKIQADLRDECGQRINWQGGPLVWFLSYRGEDWHVAGCFVDNTNDEASYCIFDLWNGDLVSKDGALQLLLIVDHIFDWARDIYRPAILRHLTSLSSYDASDNMSIANDSDIFSLNNPVGTWINRTQSVGPSNAMDISEFEDSLEIVRPLRGLDWIGGGVFRHASFVDSEFLGIHITGDNANTLLLLAKTPEHAVAFARKLIKALLNRRSILLTEETLIELEDIWTGGASHFANPVAPATEFVVRLLLKKSLSDDWNQVRELSYLAASREGLDVLINRSKPRRPSQETASACDQQSIKTIVRRHLSVPATRGLRAAIAREALSLEITESAPDGRGSKQLVLAKEEKYQAHGLIHEVYRKHKVGMREPAEPFIRKSTRIDEQTLEQAPPRSSTLQYLDKGDPLDAYRNGLAQYIFVFGKCAQISGVPDLCYYKIAGPPETPKALDMRTALQQMLHPDSKIYTTERYARTSSKTKWNLDSFHEIYRPAAEYQRGKIDSWIARLDMFDDCFDCLDSSTSPKKSSPSTAGARPSERRISSRRRQREAQHTKPRNKSQSTPTHRGKGIASKKPQCRPLVVDLNEDDTPELQADINHLCKKLCIRPEEAIRTGSPSRSSHSGEANVASSSMTTQAPDLIQPEAQALLPAVRQALKRLEQQQVHQANKDALARWWKGYTDRRSVLLGNDQANVRTLDHETNHDDLDRNAHPERPMSSTEPNDQDTEYGSNLGIQPEHEIETQIQHEQDEHHSAIMADAPADATLAENAEEVSGVKLLIQNSITNHSPPDYNFQQAMEYHPADPDSVPAVPVLREFKDMNGRWTYSLGDHGHFVRLA